MLIKIKPIEKTRWHGKEGKESFSQPSKIKALYDPTNGRYATGLSEKDKERLEKITGFNLSDFFNPNEPHEFWDSDAATVTLPNHTFVLNLEIPLDEIKYNILKASKFIANSEQDLQDGLYPEATHIIFDETEQVRIKATKVQQKLEVYKRVLKLSKAVKMQIILILSKKQAVGLNDEQIDIEIDELVQQNPVGILDLLSKPKNYIATKATIIEATYKGILTQRNKSYYYMDELIGEDIEEAVDYLLDVKHQQLKTILLSKI